jgi:hypothetical protein
VDSQNEIFFLIKMCGKENIAYFEQKLDSLGLMIYKFKIRLD